MKKEEEISIIYSVGKDYLIEDPLRNMPIPYFVVVVIGGFFMFLCEGRQISELKLT